MKIYENELEHYKNLIKEKIYWQIKSNIWKRTGWGGSEFLLSDIVGNNYKDDDLNKIPKEYLEPIYYNDDVLWDFLYIIEISPL